MKKYLIILSNFFGYAALLGFLLLISGMLKWMYENSNHSMIAVGFILLVAAGILFALTNIIIENKK